MKKSLIILFMFMLLSCSDAIEDIQEDVSVTSIIPTNTSSSTTIREITTEESSSDYLDEAFSPGYSPNELLFYEQDTKSRYFSLTRNKLIEEKIIDEGIDLITEYKNTVIFGDDETCENSSYSNSYAEKEGVSIDEHCNKLVEVKSTNFIRFPFFRTTVSKEFEDTPLDIISLGKCTDDLNNEIISHIKPQIDYFQGETNRQFNEGYNNWHRNYQQGDFQIHHISPRILNDDGSVEYKQTIFIRGSLDSPYFYLSDISEYPKNVGFISILFDFYRYYAGAANGNYFYTSLNYDLVNCKKINLEDIFSDSNLEKEILIDVDGYQTVVSKSYDNKVIELWKESGKPLWLYALTYENSKVLCLLDIDLCGSVSPFELIIANEIEYFESFLLENEGITFAYDEYQNACGACNSPNPKISYDRLFRILDFSGLENE